MGRTLGLNDDYWHLLIPVFVLVVSIPMIFLWLPLAIAYHVLFEVVLVLVALQFINEWIQATDLYVADKYGSYVNFQLNSKRDTKFFVIGLFLGLFIGFVVYAVLAHTMMPAQAILSPIPAISLPPASELPYAGL